MGKILIFLGLILTAIGIFVLFMPKIPWPGKLPGDIIFCRGDFTLYFPWVTCLLISFVLTLLCAFFRRLAPH